MESLARSLCIFSRALWLRGRVLCFLCRASPRTHSGPTRTLNAARDSSACTLSMQHAFVQHLGARPWHLHRSRISLAAACPLRMGGPWRVVAFGWARVEHACEGGVSTSSHSMGRGSSPTRLHKPALGCRSSLRRRRRSSSGRCETKWVVGSLSVCRHMRHRLTGPTCRSPPVLFARCADQLDVFARGHGCGQSSRERIWTATMACKETALRPT